MKIRRNPHRGFTVIELLVVIAVIAILAAILFPVFANARKQAHMTTCMSQINDIYKAVKQYEADNNRFPAALLGFGETAGGYYTGTGTPVSIDQITYRPLTAGQHYLRDKELFSCPHNPVQDPTLVATPVYPTNAGAAIANSPVLFTSVMQHSMGLTNTGGKVLPDSYLGQPAYYYTYDSYDIGPRVDANGNVVKDGSGNPIEELHYSLDWTGVTATTPGSDQPNQLKYGASASPNNTIITWCTYHVAYAHMDRVPVLMLSGSVKALHVSQVATGAPLGLSN